jgi:hypothetical protein
MQAIQSSVQVVQECKGAVLLNYNFKREGIVCVIYVYCPK